MKGIAVTEAKVKFDVIGALRRFRERWFGRTFLDIESSEPIVETAAQMLHTIRHRAGTGSVCGQCRAYAEAVHFIYRNEIAVVGPTAVDGWMAARERYSSSRRDGAVHGPECTLGIHGSESCSCDRAAQELAATEWMMAYQRPDLRDTWVGKLPRR